MPIKSNKLVDFCRRSLIGYLEITTRSLPEGNSSNRPTDLIIAWRISINKSFPLADYVHAYLINIHRRAIIHSQAFNSTSEVKNVSRARALQLNQSSTFYASLASARHRIKNLLNSFHRIGQWDRFENRTYGIPTLPGDCIEGIPGRPEIALVRTSWLPRSDFCIFHVKLQLLMKLLHESTLLFIRREMVEDARCAYLV